MPNVEEHIRAQLRRYPGLEVQDLVKALYQSHMGPGHFVGPDSLKRLREEIAALSPQPDPPCFVEDLGDYCRVHLRGLEHSGLSAATLDHMFALSAREPGDMDGLHNALDRLAELARSGQFAPKEGAAGFIAQYQRAGCPAPAHSPAFRALYAPAYRVVHKRFAHFMPLFCAIDKLMAQKPKTVIAIEGGSASGKTTLAATLAAVYHCPVVHMDDFFLRPHQRTAARLAQPGGNVDYERFQGEVLAPLAAGRPFAYRPYDCHTGQLGAPIALCPGPLTVVEGAYSMHPALCGAYDLSAYLSIGADEQRRRIEKRNGPGAGQFFAQWIPLEQAYFNKTNAQSRCDMTLDALTPPQTNR